MATPWLFSTGFVVTFSALFSETWCINQVIRGAKTFDPKSAKARIRAISNLPFTLNSGTSLMSHFRFDEQQTRTTLCVESATAALEHADGLFIRVIASSLQLVFNISDGRIKRDQVNHFRDTQN
mmetsp:Transcript_58359/g.68161  ORF Transcript_58359/g.68161 Transcript_58359/m.68161 type:complete len:124 (-) Transcript_58359:116-487(-)